MYTSSQCPLESGGNKESLLGVEQRMRSAATDPPGKGTGHTAYYRESEGILLRGNCTGKSEARGRPAARGLKRWEEHTHVVWASNANIAAAETYLAFFRG